MSLCRVYMWSSFAVVLASTSACGSSTTNVNAGGDAGVGGNPSTASGGSGATGGQGGTGNSQGGSTQLPGNDAGQGLSFIPSNVPNVQPSATLVGANITGTCTIDTTAGTISCLDATTQYAAKATLQDDVDATDSMVFTFNSLTLSSSAQVTVVGNRPAILVAEGAISVAGTLEATPDVYSRNLSRGGGFSAPSGSELKGGGPGAGGAPVLATHTGAGGGAYCGKGGNSNGGVAYGKLEIEPLLGGSSGGDALVQGGAGGGAIQLIAGLSVSIASTGIIHVGGGGSLFGGNGGGSGGAILLEAPNVDVRGILAANGGSGSANSGSGAASSNGSPDATAAPGGTTTSTTSTGAYVNLGGAGSAAASVDGADGQYTLNPGGGLEDFGGGGGGGAGRIRINTTSGAANIATTATLSPAATTVCVSQGKLQMR